MVFLNKTMISGHSSIHGHHNDKGINNGMINLTYYILYYKYCQNRKKVYVLGSQFIRKLCLHGYKSVQNYIEIYVNNFLNVKMPFTHT